jgi:four helix bundle protein
VKRRPWSEAVTYDQWQAGVPSEITADILWRAEAYRLSLFLSDVSWHDITRLWNDGRTRSVADQLFRATGRISANIAEGYSRGTAKSRICFYEYALGSTREARDWYHKSRGVLGDDVTDHRLKLTTQIIKLILAMIGQERRQPKNPGSSAAQ